MAERELKTVHTLCPAADNSSNENPINVTLHITTVDGKREGRIEVICPKKIKQYCLATSHYSPLDIQYAKKWVDNIDPEKIAACMQIDPS